MKVKRYICILAAILLAIALPSCGVFRPVTDAPAQPSETAASDITDVLTPEASVTVQIIYELYCQGLGQKEISRRLHYDRPY